MGQGSQLSNEELMQSENASSVLLESYQVSARAGLPTRTPKTPALQNTVIEVSYFPSILCLCSSFREAEMN